MTYTEATSECTATEYRMQFRKAVSQFATGIAIVTVEAEMPDEVHGMTINSFTSISLDPPTVLISLKPGRTNQLVSQRRRFGVSILHDDQAEYSALFSGRQDVNCRPEFVIPSQAPVLGSALAWFECELQHQVQIHDHTLFIAEVTACGSVDGAPLLFFASRYHRHSSWS